MKNSVFYIRKKMCPWEPRYSTVERLSGSNAVLQSLQVCACSERPASSGLLKYTQRQGRADIYQGATRFRSPEVKKNKQEATEKMVNHGEDIIHAYGEELCLCTTWTEGGRAVCPWWQWFFASPKL